ncbi:MAG: hypothetical protein RRB13_09815 [bacterium]|nr:hypothetical protein [bacterium]
MRHLFISFFAVLLLVSLAASCKKESDPVTISTGDSTTDSTPDVSADALSFSDTDNRVAYIQGTLNITKATDESKVDSYKIYWGSDAATKLSGESVIASKDKVNANLTYDFAANTLLPSGANYFLVFTANQVGEATTPKALAIADNTTPNNLFGTALFGTGVFGP